MFALAVAISGQLETSAHAAAVRYYGAEPLGADELEKAMAPATRRQWQGRVQRLRALGKIAGIAPTIEESIIVRSERPGGGIVAIPVLRIAFGERSFFGFNEDFLAGDALPIVDLIAELSRVDGPNTFTLIVGHTDDVGTPAYNDALAFRRAASVLKLLAERGTPAARLQTATAGQRQPIADNATADGRARNRRVEFLISASEKANTLALAQIPVRPPAADTRRAPIPDTPVDIRDGGGRRIEGVPLRPIEAVPLRPDHDF